MEGLTYFLKLLLRGRRNARMAGGNQRPEIEDKIVQFGRNVFVNFVKLFIGAI
jgi:hypothetical protein